ncbi:DUF2269 family protein [Marinicellulosiphila megalodicopiae]|uniref:DUF2269 family protein n=1 Tax=Marinicellulosiphila megalodicopiae TaxID=2724896 RepID=UPI003BAEA74A
MESMYFTMKLLHILAAVVVMGTGAGIAFFMLMAVVSKNNTVIKVITKHVVLADWLFTFPFVLLQICTGGWLMQYLGFSFQSPWFQTVGSLYLLIGLCWMFVVWIQYRLKNIAQQEGFNVLDNRAFKRMFRCWLFLGFVAFSALIIVFYYMVFKPAKFF